MEKNFQTNFTFSTLEKFIENENLLLKKYDLYKPYIKSKESKDLINSFIESANQHIKVINNKLIKLDLENGG